MTTLERLSTVDKDRVALHFKFDNGGKFVNFTNDEWDLLCETVQNLGDVPFEDLDSDNYLDDADEPTDVDMLIAEMEQGLMQDDLRDRLWDAEAQLSQERALVRRLVGIIEELA